MARKCEYLRFSQGKAFPSWQSERALGRRRQSKAALVACGLRPKADISRADGKAVQRDGMLGVGGADVR